MTLQCDMLNKKRNERGIFFNRIGAGLVDCSLYVLGEHVEQCSTEEKSAAAGDDYV